MFFFLLIGLELSLPQLQASSSPILRIGIWPVQGWEFFENPFWVEDSGQKQLTL